MFSGIIEQLGEVISITEEGSGITIRVKHSFKEPLYIDQSISHNGTCLTVVKIDGDIYDVVAIKETLRLTNLGQLKPGDIVNLERSVGLGARMDGHMVSGHIDCIGKTARVEDENGSWLFTFSYPKEHRALIISKGSITLNGISLTVVVIDDEHVTVAIIPYTYEHTNLKNLEIGDPINIEFDIIGKYIANYMEKINA